MYRVIQWATGGVGKAAIQCVIRHPELELVGCWVHSSDKEGRDAGELAGESPIGVSATTDVDALLALEADAVMYSPLLPDEAVVAAILRSGKNVVTPVGWVYPDRENPAVAAIEAAAVTDDGKPAGPFSGYKLDEVARALLDPLSIGLKVIRVRNEDVMYRLAAVLDEIWNAFDS